MQDKYVKINCLRKIGEKFSEIKFKNLKMTYGQNLKNLKMYRQDREVMPFQTFQMISKTLNGFIHT